MINLASRDVLHGWGKFLFTGIGLGLLIGATLTMAGVFRGMVDDGQVLIDKGYFNVTGIAWSGRGKIRKVDVSVDGGKNWRTARLETPVLDKCLTRFNIDWTWDGGDAILMSRATDSTGHVQPSITELRKVRGTKSIYHNNAIQSWKVVESGEVTNVQVL